MRIFMRPLVARQGSLVMNKRDREEMPGRSSLELLSQRPGFRQAVLLAHPQPPSLPAPFIIYSLHHIPITLLHPPFSWNYLELYNDICQCELQLNGATSPTEIHDILVECYMILHRMSEQGDTTLYERVADLECNIKSKRTRACATLLQESSAMSNAIHHDYFQYPPQHRMIHMQFSQEDAELVVKKLDSNSHVFDEQLLPQLRSIREQLVWYISIESSSEEELDLLSVESSSDEESDEAIATDQPSTTPASILLPHPSIEDSDISSNGNPRIVNGRNE
jgi:hypothetical protein